MDGNIISLDNDVALTIFKNAKVSWSKQWGRLVRCSWCGVADVGLILDLNIIEQLLVRRKVTDMCRL